MLVTPVGIALLLAGWAARREWRAWQAWQLMPIVAAAATYLHFRYLFGG